MNTIPTAYEIASARVAGQVAAEIIPNISGNYNPNMAHCQNKETYLAFRQEWRELYAWFTRQMRAARALYRLEVRIRRLEKQVKHREVAAHFSGPAGELYRLRERRTLLLAQPEEPAPAWWARQPVMATYYRSGVATWLLQVRKESKVQAQLGWVASHPPRA